MEKIRYGMVGGGLHAFIGEVHRKAINFDVRAELVAGCFSTKPERNLETAEAYGISKERVYSSYQEMAEKEALRPDGIQFVSIVVPNSLHYQVAKEFLLKGIHVMCEKPLCLEPKQALELEQIAKEKHLLFGVTYTYTGYTMSKVMREMVQSGKIGDIVAVNAEYVQDWLLDYLSADSDKSGNLSIWRTDPKMSGISNCVGDIGTHIENYVHYVTGLKIKRLCATVNRYGHPLDMNANILLEYDNGINGAYWCSQVAAGKLNGLTVRVYGTKGSLEWEQHYPDYLKYTPKGQPTQTLSRGNNYFGEKAAAYSRLPAGHPEGLYIAFANIYKNYISALIALKEGNSTSEFDFPSVSDGVNGVKFIHAVIESADNDSKWVNL
ncbi:MAG: Glucose-6-phosphate 3-dehydrogenase [Oscillospiraceae bacterium]